MDIKVSQCFISVDDHDKALAFYRDVLGFQVRNDVAFEGMRWVTVAPPGQPDVEIVLEPPLADPKFLTWDSAFVDNRGRARPTLEILRKQINKQRRRANQPPVPALPRKRGQKLPL